MSTALNAAIMLAGTLAAFGVLAGLLKALRGRRLGFSLRGLTAPIASRRLAVEEVCAIDPRRRLLLVRCDAQHILLMTGGPADLVVSTMPAMAGAAA